jgi:hypothetical protein
MAHPSGECKRIASCLLLVLLTSNLFHIHLHGWDLRGVGTWQQEPRTLFSLAADSDSSANIKVLPCLACICQKQKIAILSAQALLAKLVQFDSCSIKSVPSFKKQPFLPIDLSRAPPYIGPSIEFQHR